MQANNFQQDQYSAITMADKLVQEPEKIRKWREEQKQRIQSKDAEEEQKKKEWRESAKKSLRTGTKIVKSNLLRP